MIKLMKTMALTISLACASLGNVAQAQDEVVVGAPLALSGAFAFYGVNFRNGLETAIKMANDAGGVNGMKIRLLIEDDGSDKAQAVSIATRMILRDKIVAILGPSTTPEALAIAPLVNEKSIPMIANSPSPAVRKAGDWTFHVGEEPADAMGNLARYAAEDMAVKRISVIFAKESQGFVGQKKLVIDFWKNNGVEVVSDNAVSASDSDFTALGTKLANEKLDAIAVFLPPELAANMIIQARQAGLPMDTPVVAPPGVVAQAFLDTGGAAVEGTVLLADYFPATQSKENLAFVAAFRESFGKTPDNWAATGFTAGQIFINALAIAGNDSTKLRDAIAATKDMPSILGGGKYSYSADREPNYGGVMLHVKDGAFTLIK